MRVQVGVARLGAAGVGERLAEPGVSVDLDQQGGQMDLWKAGGDGLRERLAFGGNLLGGQWRHDQVAVFVDAGQTLARRVSQHPFKLTDSAVQLAFEPFQVAVRVQVGASYGAEVVALTGPPLWW